MNTGVAMLVTWALTDGLLYTVVAGMLVLHVAGIFYADRSEK